MSVQRDNEYVICFLKGLNDSYNTVKTQILLMDPLPSLTKTFGLVTQQECKTFDPTSQDPTQFAAANNTGPWTLGNRGNTLKEGAHLIPKVVVVADLMGNIVPFVENSFTQWTHAILSMVFHLAPDQEEARPLLMMLLQRTHLHRPLLWTTTTPLHLQLTSLKRTTSICSHYFKIQKLKHLLLRPMLLLLFHMMQKANM